MEKQAKSKVFKVLIHNHQWAVFTTRGCGNGYPQSMWIPVTQTEKSRKTEILKSLFCTTNHGADPNRNMWVLNSYVGIFLVLDFVQLFHHKVWHGNVHSDKPRKSVVH